MAELADAQASGACGLRLVEVRLLSSAFFMNVYPLKFKPIFKQRIWGGQKLREFFGKDIPPFDKIGESWELADLANGESVVANGRLAGQTLSSILAKYPKEITGDENFTPPFPLLIKFLDAEDILSVQVHPDAKTCKQMGTGQPKTECWYIISAATDAVIYKGLKKGVTKKDFAEGIRDGSVAELLEKVPVKAGQCHFLPAGTAHAIGAGLLIAEIQTPSDTTYRVFDWNRVDAAGKSRQLHIEQALQSIHFDAAGDNLTVTQSGRLVDCEYFRIDKHVEGKGGELLFPAGKMRTVIVLAGSGKISGTEQIPVEFKAGDCLLVPAASEWLIQFADDTQVLTVY